MGFASLQDGGRGGWRHEGIPSGGFADAASAGVANRLLGRRADAPLLELALASGRFRFDSDTAVSIAGAVATVELNDEVLPAYRRIRVRADDLLTVRGPYRGRYLYIAVADLCAGSHWCGSVSPVRLGNSWRPSSSVLATGMRLESSAPPSERRADRGCVFAKAPPLSTEVLRMWPGPEFTAFENWVVGHDVACPRLSDVVFHVSPDSNRVGIRLGHRLGNRLRSVLPDLGEMRSSPTIPGTVQVLPDGHLAISSVDGPTMGGYPRIGVLDSIALGQLSQITDVVRLEISE